MIVKSVRLRHFRNYNDVNFSFDPGLNIITGNNAQGKTNLLESLIYLSLTRSHRISDDKQLIQNYEMFASIECHYMDQDIEKDIEAIIHPKGKTLMIHRQPVKRSSEFVGLLNVVLFSPDDLTMFSDSPKERRRIMNQEITKISGSYLLSLNQYQSFLKERNIILKNYDADQTLLDTLDEQMSCVEVKIIEQRRRFVETIDLYMNDLYKKLSDDTVDVHVKYRSCMDQDIDQNKILQMHRSYRQRDLDNHVTTSGIHREDMTFEMNGKNLIQIASQGQKRMTVLSFKMALLKYIYEVTGKKPVLLLDDVLSELDDSRQFRLMEMVGHDYQCLITATGIPDFLKNKNMKIFHIENGNIKGGSV